MAEPETMLQVQVCYADPERQILMDIRVAAGTTLDQAVERSGILAGVAPSIITTLDKGIFGKRKSGETVLLEGDRVELYRALIADPKEMRRKRAGGKMRTAEGRPPREN